jgi:hypothetical protein
MNSTPRRICLGLAFLATAKLFDFIVKPHVPDNEFGALVYFGMAATVDCIMFHVCRIFVDGTLCRDVEALCIASMVSNAIGLTLYLAPSPPLPFPDTYVWAIQGINYVLAIRLLFVGDGNVIHYLNDFNWRAVVRSPFHRYQNHATKEKNS